MAEMQHGDQFKGSIQALYCTEIRSQEETWGIDQVHKWHLDNLRWKAQGARIY